MCLIQSEGVCQADTFERLISAVHQVGERRLDVDRRNVIGQQDDFVGVKFVPELMEHLLLRNQATLKQTGDECPCPCEGVHDVDALASQGLAKLAFQHVIDGADNEVHDFQRCVDNAEAFFQARESLLEKAIIEFLDDLLPTIGRIYARGAFPHIGIEVFQRVCFLVQAVLVQRIQNGLHGL